MTPDEPGLQTTTFARWLTRAPLLLSRHLWVWPILGAFIISLSGLWVHRRLEAVTRTELASRLQTLLNADVAALRLWFSEQEADVKALAADVRIQGAIVELADLAKDTNQLQAGLESAAATQTLRLYLKPLLESQNYLDFVVLNKDRRVIASTHPRQVGRLAPRGYDLFLERALAGEPAISRPFARETTISQRAEGPTMFVAAPVRSTNGTVVAALALRMKPEEEFSQILSVARMGKTGEVYAFDRRGMMLTVSRFDQQLKDLGLIPNAPEATSILNLRLLDPEVDLKLGKQGAKPRIQLHLTRMAASATRGQDDLDVDGYRNYRGAKVIGAWAWLPEYGMGVATEVEAEEAFQTLYLLRQTVLVLFLLLVISAAAIFGFTLLVERLQSSIRNTALAARRLGPYLLLHEIGRGANGMVFRARHSLLRRPVAIKLLSPEMTNDATAARFEHEVQMTSQLTHPNTVAIYDYGRTPEGLFYYAMEYLSGINLDRLVRHFGPQPEARVVHILRQVCGSLAEAHRIGLIHRDVKPANIVLTRRGGLCDVVKVLDFGLVKADRRTPGDGLKANAVVGTPHFMSPEAVRTPESVDARSDLYSVGAVGYWLLTGRTLFDTEDIDELLEQQVTGQPVGVSDRLGRQVSSDLEALILRCLAKEPSNRPQSAEALANDLVHCEVEGAWGEEESEHWWKVNVVASDSGTETAVAPKTLVIAHRG